MNLPTGLPHKRESRRERGHPTRAAEVDFRWEADVSFVLHLPETLSPSPSLSLSRSRDSANLDGVCPMALLRGLLGC